MTSTNCSCFLFRFSFLFFRFSRSFNSLSISYFTVSIEREYHLCWCTLLLDVDILTILWLTFWLDFLTECFLKIFNFCVSFLVFFGFCLSNFYTIYSISHRILQKSLLPFSRSGLARQIAWGIVGRMKIVVCAVQRRRRKNMSWTVK